MKGSINNVAPFLKNVPVECKTVATLATKTSSNYISIVLSYKNNS